MFEFTTEANGTSGVTTESSINSSVPLGTNTSVLNMSPSSNDLDQVSYYHPLRWIESTAAIFGNILVIVSVARFKHLRTATGSLIANLAIADLISACLMPLTVSVEAMAYSKSRLYVCIAKESLYIIATFANILNLTMISFDRLICLTKPFWYMKNLTLSVALACEGIMWAVVIPMFVLLYSLKNIATENLHTCIYFRLLVGSDLKYFMVYPYCFFTLLTICNYIILAVLVWKQGKKVMTTGASSANNNIQARHRQLTKVTGIVVASYLFLTLPAVLTIMVSLF